MTDAGRGARGAADAGLGMDSRTVGPFRENSYLLMDRASRAAVLVDPGDEPDVLLAMVRESRADLLAIWLTHAHLDHIGAVAAIRRELHVPVHLHRADLPVYRDASEAARGYGVPFEQPDDPDQYFADGDVLALGALSFQVHHTPGHAPGHVMLVGAGVVIGGDLLFAGSIGRTDLPRSDPAAMELSLARALRLDDALPVHPGHGPATTIGTERATNPFLAGLRHAAAD